MPKKPSVEQSGRFSGSWKTVAICCGVLSLGLIGALATVGFIEGVDALSTIALTLAVIAFIAQLVIFAIQTTHSTSQLDEARTLNRETSGLLAETRSRIDTTYQMVSSHNDMLLRMSNLKTQETAVTETSDATALAPLIAAEVGSTREATSSEHRLPRSSYVGTVTSWPGLEAAEKALSMLEPLSDKVVTALSLDVSHYVFSKQQQVAPGIAHTSPDDSLIELELVRVLDPDSTSKLVVPTDLGLAVSRLLFAEWPPPEALSDLRARILVVREKSSVSAMTSINTLLRMTIEQN